MNFTCFNCEKELNLETLKICLGVNYCAHCFCSEIDFILNMTALEFSKKITSVKFDYVLPTFGPLARRSSKDDQTS